MGAELVQFIFAGLTNGAIYALVGLGFAIIYNASHVINFAQGEFVMIGSMTTVFLIAAGLPMPIAALLAIGVTILAGLALEKFAVETAKDADVITLIIITVGASIFLRGVAEVVFDRQFHSLPPFTGTDPVTILGASVVPQMLWVLGVTLVLVVLLQLFFSRTLWGKAILATAHNALAAKLVGIDTRKVLLASFGLSAALGAIAGILVTPITSTNYAVGIMLGLKGFSAAILGGLGSGMGAIVGGLILGVAESLGAGYVSSEYKDAIAFLIILGVLFFMPTGLFGTKGTERV